MKNKILSIILIIALLMGIFSTSCFATDLVIDGSIINVVVPDECSDYVIIKYDNGSFSLFSFDSSLGSLRINSSNSIRLYDSNDNDVTGAFTRYTGVITDNNLSFSLYAAGSRDTYFSVVSIDYILFSTNDIIDSSNNVVFQGASPQKVGELAKIVEPLTLTGILQEIVELLPIVMIVVVGFLALRKALQTLQTFLRRS